jgi:hypothetical protein
VGYNIRPEDVRAMLAEGFHPAETWMPAHEDTLHYYLQARWYMENAGVVAASADGALHGVTGYRPSSRPRLSNPEGFTSGRQGETYSAIYQHPEGVAPAQSEVWIDVNGDGRFDPDRTGGERFLLRAQQADFRRGVQFKGEAPSGRSYVFRFARVILNQ